VKPLRRPPMTETQSFEDDEWLAQLARVLDGPIEGKVGRGPSGRRHPVQDGTALAPDGRVIDGTDTDRWDHVKSNAAL